MLVFITVLFGLDLVYGRDLNDPNKKSNSSSSVLSKDGRCRFYRVCAPGEEVLYVPLHLPNRQPQRSQMEDSV